MELRDLEVFMAVIERGGFRSAAEALHLAQGSVSRRVAQLERELGVRLVARTVPIAPTPAGEVLYGRIAPLVRDLRSVLEQTRTSAAPSLRVGYISPAIVGMVPALLDVLRRQTPSPSVELHELPSAEVRDGLHSGRLTLGFLLEDEADGGLDFLALQSFRYAIALPASDALARRGTVRVADLAGRTFLTLARREPVHARILAQVQRGCPGLQHQDAFGFSEVQHLVASGLGFAAVPAGLMAGPPPGIAVVDVTPPLPTATLGVAARRPVPSGLREVLRALGTRAAAAGPRPVAAAAGSRPVAAAAGSRPVAAAAAADTGV